MTASGPSRFAVLAAQALAEASRPVGAVQPCVQLRYDECFVVLDKITSKPLPGLHYRIEAESCVVEGITDGRGRTERIYTGEKAEHLELFLVNPDDDEFEEENIEYGCL